MTAYRAIAVRPACPRYRPKSLHHKLPNEPNFDHNMNKIKPVVPLSKEPNSPENPEPRSRPGSTTRSALSRQLLIPGLLASALLHHPWGPVLMLALPRSQFVKLEVCRGAPLRV